MAKCDFPTKENSKRQ